MICSCLDELQVALPTGVEVLGCVAVYDQQIPMSVLTLIQSLSTLSSRAIGLISKSASSLSGIWVMGDLRSFLDGKGCSITDISKEESEFLSSHLHFRSDLVCIVSSYK